MKIKKTYEQLSELSSIASGYLSRHQGTENRLCEKIRNLARTQIKKHLKSLNEQDEILRIDFCAIDEKTKVILRDEHGKYQFTREGIKELHRATKHYRETTILELDSCIIEDVPDDLTQEEIECFLGLLIPADYTSPSTLPSEEPLPGTNL